MKIVPWEEAEAVPVGAGRAEPNHSPFCPPPQGRLKFTMNPFSVLEQLAGRAIYRKIMCCGCLIVFALIMIFAGAPLQMALSVYLAR